MKNPSNPERPLVSVVMIFFNADTAYMHEAIASVFAQTYEQWELVLVDDGSADESSTLAREYARRYPEQVRYLEHPGHQNRGMSASRNAGVAAARGSLIAFLDADDVYLPPKLERQVAALRNHPAAAMVYSATEHWYSWTGQPGDQGRDRLRRLGVSPDTLVAPPALLPLFLRLDAQTPGTCGVLVRRETIESVGGFEERFRGMFEDQVFFYKICAAMPVFVQGGVWDRYRQHPASCAGIARQAGHDQTKGPSPLYGAFLSWLETYLAGRQLADPATWRALRTELLPYRRPWLYAITPRAVRRRARSLRLAVTGAGYRAFAHFAKRWPYAAYVLRRTLRRAETASSEGGE